MSFIKKSALGVALIFAVLSVAACHRSSVVALVSPVSMSEIGNPAQAGSTAPKLTVNARGEFLLAWAEPGENKLAALKFAAYDGKNWSESATVTSRKLNVSEFASSLVAQTKAGAYVAFWTETLSENPWKEFAYSATSADGRSWSQPRLLHRDESASEHSFLSAVPMGDDGVRVVWLDGRETATVPYPAGHYHLMTTVIGNNVESPPEQMLDDNVCTCCPTAVAPFENGYVVAYRDRTADEIRDMSLVKVTDGQASAPISVHRDGWQINACPTNGPALAVSKDLVAVSWYTNADDQSKLLMAFAPRLAEGFQPPVQIDLGSPFGRPALAFLSDGSSIVVWEENNGVQVALYARRVSPDMKVGTPTLVSEDVSGFPSMKSSGDVALLAYYRKQGNTTRIQTLLLR